MGRSSKYWMRERTMMSIARFKKFDTGADHLPKRPLLPSLWQPAGPGWRAPVAAHSERTSAPRALPPRQPLRFRVSSLAPQRC